MWPTMVTGADEVVRRLIELAGEAILRGDAARARGIVAALEQHLSQRLWRLVTSALQFLDEGDDLVACQLLAHCAEAARTPCGLRNGA